MYTNLLIAAVLLAIAAAAASFAPSLPLSAERINIFITRSVNNLDCLCGDSDSRCDIQVFVFVDREYLVSSVPPAVSRLPPGCHPLLYISAEARTVPSTKLSIRDLASIDLAYERKWCGWTQIPNANEFRNVGFVEQAPFLAIMNSKLADLGSDAVVFDIFSPVVLPRHGESFSFLPGRLLAYFLIIATILGLGFGVRAICFAAVDILGDKLIR